MMQERRSLLFLILIMTLACSFTTGMAILMLYFTALKEQQERLAEIVISQTRLIEAVSRFDKIHSEDYPDGSFAATISQIREAHASYKGLGTTGELCLAHLDGDRIVYLLEPRHSNSDKASPKDSTKELTEPMRLALAGQSGSTIGLDYRGKKVVAAFEPIPELGLGVVAKIDLKEIQGPFKKAALVVFAITLVVILIGAALFRWISQPIIIRLAEQNKKLKQSEQFLHSLLDAIPVPVFYKDRKGRYLGCNKRLLLFFDMTYEDLIGKTASEVFSSDNARLYHTTDLELMESGGRVEKYEVEVRAAGGEKRKVISQKAAFTDQRGDVAGLIGTIMDVTDIRRTEKEAWERERLLLEMGRIAKIGGWEHDLVAKRASWTDETYKIMELEANAPVPSPSTHLDFHPGKYRNAVQDATAKAIDTGVEFDIEVRCKTCSGRVFWARLIGQPEIVEKRCVRIRGVIQDITEQKNLEERLRQSQKLEAVGALAGGVAHDYNNMLSVIIGYTGLLLGQVDKEDPFHDDLKEIEYAALRSADITRQLLAFARKQPIAPKVLDLNATISGMLKMLGRLIGEDVELSFRPADTLWPVRLDPSQIDQLLINLCVNGRDAISSNGKITIETKNLDIDQDYCNFSPDLSPGQYLMLTVSDNGCGMDETMLKKAFDPFFTTKELHQGTGLGLATVYGIVTQNGGAVHIYSELNQGTTVKLYLPRHGNEPQDKYAKADDIIPLGHGERILLVEDETRILRLGSTILEELGYEVTVASSPEQALQLEFKQQIDLLITDVIMPGMNGQMLAEKLVARYPGMRVLYMSGYTANVIADQGILENGGSFMAKPFTKKELASFVHNSLCQ